MPPQRRLGLPLGVPLGLAGLAALVAFGVLLPKAHGSESVDLPDTLPGGWQAVDEPTDEDDESVDPRSEAVQYVNDVYADVYDEPVAFRVYSDEELEAFAVVTVFTGESQAFGPPNGLADPEAQELARAGSELTREGDAVCLASFQPVPAGEDASAGPLSVTCSLPTDGHTVQVTASERDAEETAELAAEIGDQLQ